MFPFLTCDTPGISSRLHAEGKLVLIIMLIFTVSMGDIILGMY